MTTEKPMWGASPAAWDHFDKVLGLGPYLLPVVSNIKGKISPASGIKDIGKVPSKYNRRGHVVGIEEWAQKPIPADVMAAARANTDYGFGINTLLVRGADIDVSDPAQSKAILAVITKNLGILPRRGRKNSNRSLVAFILRDDDEHVYRKRVITTAHGIVEFIAGGNQFVAIGTHPSGERYGWHGGFPKQIPEVTHEQFEACWKELQETFGVAPAKNAKTSTRLAVEANAASADPVVIKLIEKNMILGNGSEGKIHIVCPFEHEHSEKSADSSTSYLPAHTKGYAQGNFSCLHAHCVDRPQYEFREAIGITVLDQFDVIPEQTADKYLHPQIGTDRTQNGTVQDPASFTDGEQAEISNKPLFTFEHAADFASAATPRYIIKGVIPEAELVVIYGASASGKTFAVLDLAIAIARDIPWGFGELRTHGGRVAYVVAEGASFFRSRLTAYAMHHKVSLEDIDLHILGSAPNLLSRKDTAALIDSLRELGPLKLIVIDTLAQTMAGGDENAGVDMMKVLSHCKAIHKHTGATIMLVHHSGKDETKGARGWSGLRAACDAELEVVRNDTFRSLRVSKQKDGADGLAYPFRLATVGLDLDEDGDLITSCVVEHTDPTQAATASSGGVRGSHQKLVHKTVMELIGPGGTGVLTGKLLEAVIANIPHDPEQKRDMRRKRAMDALDSLISGGYLRLDDKGCVNLPIGDD